MLWPNINIESNAQYFIPIFHFVQCTRKNAKVQKTSYQYTLKLAIFQFDPVNAITTMIPNWTELNYRVDYFQNYGKLFQSFSVLEHLSRFMNCHHHKTVHSFSTRNIHIHETISIELFLRLCCSIALCLSKWLTYSLKY